MGARAHQTSKTFSEQILHGSPVGRLGVGVGGTGGRTIRLARIPGLAIGRANFWQ